MEKEQTFSGSTETNSVAPTEFLEVKEQPIYEEKGELIGGSFKTGEVFIQFDGQEEEKFADFLGNGNLELVLRFPPKEEREPDWIPPEIVFTSKTGRTMRIFIKDI